MAKKKSQARSGAKAAPMDKVEEILPTGGLAILQPTAPEVVSNATTIAGHAAIPRSNAPSSYFTQFGDFQYQVDASFLKQFNSLAIHENWGNAEKKRRRHQAVEAEFSHVFGTDTKDVSKWQELCRIVGINTAGLTSIKKCKKELSARKTKVNIVNLVDHLKNGTPLRKFKNFYEFQTYTLKPGRCVSRDLVKKNGFIRVLLREVV